MKINILLLLCVSLLVVWGLVAIDAPAPAYADYWQKDGVSAAQTQQFLYQTCGFVDKTGNDDASWVAQFAQSERCMLHHGFTYVDTPNGHWGKCGQAIYRDFPSCASIR